MDGLLRDLAFSVRALTRAPLLLGTAALTLAIGIGISTGVLAVAYGVFLRPLPFADPPRLVVISVHRGDEPATDIGVRLPDVDEWRRRARAFESIAGHSAAAFTLRGAGEPRSVRAAMVTDGFFDLLGVPPAEGLTGGIAGANPEVALSAGLTDQLGRGGTWRASGVSVGRSHFHVSAIMPRTFNYPSERIELWVAADAVPKISLFGFNDQRDFHLLARLRPGVTLAQARDDAVRVSAEMNQGLTENRQRFASVRSLDDELRRDARATLAPFLVGAALVLLIACANVSGLLMGRAAARSREFSVRRALGGSTAHLLRAALVESGGITLCGWAAGLWLAHMVMRGFAAFGPDGVGNLQEPGLDGPVVAGSLLLAAVVAVVTGAAPAIPALRSGSGAALRQAPERMARSGGVVQSALLVGQIALTVVLLVSAGLLLRTVMTIVSAERGFDPRHALATRLMLSETVRFDVSDRAQFIDRLVAEVRGLPGVVHAGIGSDLPPNGAQLMMTVQVETDTETEMFPLSFSAVTPGYLEAIGAAVVTGRLFQDADRLATVPPVVISASAASRIYPGRDPLGREWPVSIPSAAGRSKPVVIGVVRDIKYGGLDRAAPASVFAPWERIAPSQAHLVVRTTGDPLALALPVQRTLRQLDPTMPVFTPSSLEEVAAGSIAGRRLRLQLAVVFAGLALLLASVAIWGAVAQRVVERRRELAIRMALGSTGGEAVGLIVRSGGVLIAAGVVIGLVCAGLSAQALGHLLHGVTPFDPQAFTAGAALAAGLSLLACYAPARRAAAISPAELLREG